MNRIAAFLNPDEWAGSAAYQAKQSLIALGCGGMWGKGLGRGICKYGHLPEDTTDFVFSIIGEELGLIGTFLIVLAFLLYFYRGIRISLQSPDRFGFYLGLGITLMVVLQGFINISMVLAIFLSRSIKVCSDLTLS